MYVYVSADLSTHGVFTFANEKKFNTNGGMGREFGRFYLRLSEVTAE